MAATVLPETESALTDSQRRRILIAAAAAAAVGAPVRIVDIRPSQWMRKSGRGAQLPRAVPRRRPAPQPEPQQKEVDS